MTQQNSRLVVTTPSDRELVITRVFDAPREMVFDAYTKPEYLKRWFGGPREWRLETCEVDLRPGGSWRFVLRNDNGNEMPMKGEYLEVERPSRLVSTESFDEEMVGWRAEDGPTINTVTFEESDGKTTMTITVLYKSKELRDAAVQSPMEEGLAVGLERLDEFLQSAA